jgi:hypothetical protein
MKSQAKREQIKLKPKFLLFFLIILQFIVNKEDKTYFEV